jgi:hypothetical protein
LELSPFAICLELFPAFFVLAFHLLVGFFLSSGFGMHVVHAFLVLSIDAFGTGRCVCDVVLAWAVVLLYDFVAVWALGQTSHGDSLLHLNCKRKD